MSNIVTIPFGDSFIERLADYMDTHFIRQGRDLRRIAVVFGGRRPRLFLQRALAKRIKKPFFPPQYLTIDQWMRLNSHQGNHQAKYIGDLDHAYLIYQLSQQHCPDLLINRNSFSLFLPWAREIISFIEQCDLELVPAKELHVLKEHAALGFDVPEDINRLLASILKLRNIYHAHLKNNGLLTRGYVYFMAAMNEGHENTIDVDTVIFANFFYLHKSEMVVMKRWVDAHQGILMIQGDERKWPALKRIAQAFNTAIVEGKEIKPSTFDVKLYAAVDAHAQAAIVRDIIEQIPDKDDTVIVLPDTATMLPMISALSNVLGNFNISMGYPLKRSALYSVLTFLVQAQKSAKDGMYYARDYLSLLRHPLIKGLDINFPDGLMRVIVHKIEEALTGQWQSPLNGQIFIKLEDVEKDQALIDAVQSSLSAIGIKITAEQIHKHMAFVHDILFIRWQEIQSFDHLADVLRQCLEVLKIQSHKAAYPLNDVIASRLEELCVEFKQIAFTKDLLERFGMFTILLDYASSLLVAFSGSPLTGLQMLGLFETRSLSFKHVIVVDTNEGALPNLNIYEPLIPREVMIQLNLDRLELEEEIQRYQFMRLICSASNVHLIYVERAERERSRFIEELVWEKELSKGSLDIIPVKHQGFELKPLQTIKQIPKTGAIIDYLRNFTYSASSLNAYIQNPYEFYTQYVLGLKPKDDLLDDPQSKHIGIFVHELLESVFKPFLGKKPIIDDAFIKKFMQFFEARFYDHFGKGLRPDAFLIKSVIEVRLKRFLEIEAKRCEQEVAEILFIEKQFNYQLDLPSGKINMTLKVDRVDRLNDGTIMIMDYKTGLMNALPKPEDLSMNLTKRQELRDQVGSIQLPLYFLYLNQLYPASSINAGLYYLRNGEFKKFINQSIDRPLLVENIKHALTVITDELFNPTIPFSDDPQD